jgi:hypothetical protein
MTLTKIGIISEILIKMITSSKRFLSIKFETIKIAKKHDLSKIDKPGKPGKRVRDVDFFKGSLSQAHLLSTV